MREGWRRGVAFPPDSFGGVRGRRANGCDVVLVARNREGSFVAALLRMTAERQMQIPHFVRDDTRVGRDGCTRDGCPAVSRASRQS